MNVLKILQILYFTPTEKKLRLLFIIFGILLGIILYTSIRISSENIKLSIEASNHYFHGENIARISSNIGDVPENLIPQLINLPGIKLLSPISEQKVEANIQQKKVGYVHVIGIDMSKVGEMMFKSYGGTAPKPFNYLKYFEDKPVYVFASPAIYDKAKDTPIELMINNKIHPVMIGSIIPESFPNITLDELKIIMDIKNFQNIFEKYEYSNEIVLFLFDDDNSSTIQQITKILPTNLKINQSTDKSQFAKKITSTFRFNLNFLIFLSLLVTAIIIYNSISYYVLERRKEFGILLMLGAQPIQTISAIIIGNTLLAITCAVIGIFFGYFLSKQMIQMISTSISNIYFPLSVTQIHLTPYLVFEILIVTIVITFLASIIPCLDIYTIPMRETIIYQTYENNFKKNIKYITLAGIAILLISLLGISDLALSHHIGFAYVALIGIIFSIAFFQPIILIFLIKLTDATLGRYFFAAKLATKHISTTMRKHVVAIAAMSMAITLCAICFIIIDSTRVNVLNWLKTINSADIYITDKGMSTVSSNYLSNDFINTVINLPEIKAYNVAVYKDILYNNIPVKIEGTKIDTTLFYNAITLINPLSTSEKDIISKNPNYIFISDRTANQLHLKKGDTFSLPGIHENYPVQVAGIYYNYSSDRNFILISQDLFSKLYDEPRVQSLILYLKDPKQVNDVIYRIQNKFPNLPFHIQNQYQLKANNESIVKQAFRVGDVILIITLMIAIFTLFSTLEELIIDRMYEFSLLWTLGASDKQIIKLCLWESLLIGLAAIVNAIIPTVIILYIIFYYLNELYFGTKILIHIPYWTGIVFLFVLVVISLLTGLLPALRMKNFINMQWIRYE